VRGSGVSWAICKSAPHPRQITMPASHHSVFTGQMPFLPPNQQRQSTEGNTNLNITNTTTTTTILRLSGFCLGQSGWAGTRRNIHPLTNIVVINHPLSVSSIYTVRHKKHTNILLCITSQNINRFSKFFHCLTQEEICYKPVIIYPTTP